MSSAMLRSLPGAAPSSAPFRLLPPRIRTQQPHLPAATCLFQQQSIQKRHAGLHAISNPTLAGIEKRWEGMPPQEQAELWMALRDRMKNDWHEMTLQERKASYWIAFGPHGPRALDPPGEGKFVFWCTMAGVGVSAVIFMIIRQFAKPAPKTMNAQYQALTNEYLKSQKTEPITGVSSEGYTGKGMIQSKPRKGGIPSDDDE